jgi:hypothetical protein
MNNRTHAVPTGWSLGVLRLCLLALAVGFSASCRLDQDSTPRRAGSQTAEAEPNDDLGSAQKLGSVTSSFSAKATGSIQALGADQFDAFQVDVAQGVNLKFSVKPGQASSDVDLWLTAADGSPIMRLESSTLGGTEMGTYAATAGEKLYLVVLAFEADTTYELNVSAG